MALRGDLASVDLAQVFQMLSLNQKVGLLYIQSPTSWKALYFDERGVTLYFNEHTMLDRVLGKLIRGGKLSAEGVAEAREHAAHQGHQVIDSLLAGRYLTEEQLDEGIRTEIEEEVYELFFWYDAKFEFFEGATEYEGREGVIRERFFFGTDMLIMEAARRIDEWGYIETKVASGLEVFRPVGKGAKAMNLDEELFQVFELVDGVRNVQRIIEIAALPSFQIFKSVCCLLDEEVIEPLPPKELLSTGKACMTEGRVQDAINLFEKAIEAEVGLPDVHALAAEAYGAIREYELQGYHNKCLAEHHAASGNLKEAIALFRQVLECIPTDLEACQRVVELSVDRPELATDDFDPLNVGKDLVDLFVEIGEIDRVRRLLEELIREHPTDVELKKSLINVHTKVGDTKRVIELYESIAEDLTRNGSPIEAIKYLQKILQLNRARTDISEWIKRLYQADERRKSRRRSMVALGMMFALLVVATIGYFFYNEAAWKQFKRIDLKPLVAKEDFAGARTVIKQFMSAYPFTMAVKEAERELSELRAKESARHARREREEAEEQSRLERIRYQYRNAWQVHLKHIERKELELALRVIENVRDLVAKGGQPDDLQWAATKHVDKSYAELQTYLTTADRLSREARASRDRGDWQTQRKLVLELIDRYGMADPAKRALIPVQIVTRPAGAKIYADGKPVMQDNGSGQSVPVTTPAVIDCPDKSSVKYTVHKAGFDWYELEVAPRRADTVHAILAIIPAGSLKFGVPALASPASSPDGKVVVELQGGKMGISLNGDAASLEVELPGLTAMDGRPSVTAKDIFFATSDSELVCHRVSDGKRAWGVPIGTPLVFEPLVSNNRVYLVDRDGKIRCLSAAQGGRLLWTKQMKGPAVGQPTVFGRDVGVGSSLGTILVLDALTGEVSTSIEVQRGVTTQVLLNKGLLVFGTEDGRVHGYRRGAKSPAWSVDIGRAVREGEFILSEDREWVYLVGKDNHLLRMSLVDGRVVTEKRMEHRIRRGIVALNGKVFVVLQVGERQKNESIRFWDLLLALDPVSLESQWKFSDGGDFKGRLSAGAKRLFVTGSNGEVYRFQ